ncbi:UNVERIFIED_CONTAM: hypothetical protein K2H54_053501 [Gekko kuhli]
MDINLLQTPTVSQLWLSLPVAQAVTLDGVALPSSSFLVVLAMAGAVPAVVVSAVAWTVTGQVAAETGIAAAGYLMVPTAFPDSPSGSIGSNGDSHLLFQRIKKA